MCISADHGACNTLLLCLLVSQRLLPVADLGSLPQWVDWPDLSTGDTLGTRPESKDETIPTVPILMAPPHLRAKHQQLPSTHTPPMNPQPDAKLTTPVATPKGQRLFDFWHQKVDQQAPDTAPPQPVSQSGAHVASGADAVQHSSSAQRPVDSGVSHHQDAKSARDLADKLAMLSTPSQQAKHAQQALRSSRPVPMDNPLVQMPVPAQAPTAQLTATAAAWLLEGPSQSVAVATTQHQLPSAGPGPEPSVQSDSTPAGLVAELETASRLVHQQSLQQAQLLDGLEHALAELSEQRLLIQNRQAAHSMDQQTTADGTMRPQTTCDTCNRLLSLLAGCLGGHFDLTRTCHLLRHIPAVCISSLCVHSGKLSQACISILPILCIA